MGVSTATVPVGPIDLSIAEAGRGGRPLLLVHGFTGAKEDFGDWMDALADQGWWVVAPDLRGHGASSHPPHEADYSLATFATDLLGLADELGWASFSLLGHSMGGMVAQELVLGVPGRIDRLVLMDTCSGRFEGLDPEVVAIGVDYLRAEGLLALLALLDAFPADRAPAEQRVRDERPGHVAWSEAKVRSVSPSMYAAMGVELSTRTDRLAELATIPVPTRVVVGDQDRDFIGPSRRMAEAIGTADLVVIPDAAHSPQFENPQGWWDAVAPFLADAHLIVD